MAADAAAERFFHALHAGARGGFLMKTYTVAKIDELAEGQIKQVQAGDHEVLLVKLDGEIHALAATCPHHGAPLENGLLHEGQLICPWHMTTYDARNGKLRQPPAMDALPQFDVSVEGGEVRVTLPEAPPQSCTVPMASREADDERTFVVLGAGAAGMTAAESLRQEGFTGEIVMITREDAPPYDRTALSKSYLRSDDPSEPTLRSKAFYDEHDINLQLGFAVAQVDTIEHVLRAENGREQTYDKLLLATGSVPRTLDVPGGGLEGVVTLRSYADGQSLRDRIQQAHRVVLVGASFIGMEVAAGCVEQDADVSIVAPEAVPFEKVFGEDIGRMYQNAHEEKGVTFHLGATVGHFAGEEHVQAVVLEDGTELPADLVILGVGVRPATDYLKDSHKNDDGSVTVNSYMQMRDDIYAAGDIATFSDWRLGRPARIEHWRVAQQQGRIAAQNMLDQQVEYRRVPFFWTNQYMIITDYLGHAEDWDEIVVDGKVDEQDFLAYYIKDQAVQAVAGCGRSRQTIAALEILENQPLPTLQTLQAEIDKLAG
jgi:NADPH-dependent 2,4-dienoyl-CoA reductase/sulfur reductase-like enzyme/nitrite reductase/ring-hydroxylating ferredoxin subunit